MSPLMPRPWRSAALQDWDPATCALVVGPVAQRALSGGAVLFARHLWLQQSRIGILQPKEDSQESEGWCPGNNSLTRLPLRLSRMFTPTRVGDSWAGER